MAATRSPPGAGRWERLFAPHLDAAYRLACWLTGSRAEAEDVLQDACLRAWRSASVEPRDAKAWLLTIVRNASLTRLRRARGTNIVPFEEAVRDLDRAQATLPSAEAALMEGNQVAALRHALAELPAVFREAVVLRDIEELSYREIAAVLDLPIGTVMSRIARGRRQLRAALTREGFDVRDTG
jgi:RNA polymerase sigma-70 factor (ECF subfamily)